MGVGVDTATTWSDAALRGVATVDPLTQLGGAWLFRDRIDHAAARLNRDGRMVGVLAVEVCGLPDPSDARRDEVIVAAADWLRNGIRTADTLTRIDGPWFGVVLEGIDSRA